MKGKVNRARHWNDNRRIYKSLFEYLCFISQRSAVSSFSRDKLVNFVADSLAYMNEDKNLADKVTTELTTMTNLIIEDGFNEYRFIHKSIQEFFASAFVCILPQDKKHQFYTKCRKDIAFHSIFDNTLFFLEEIDYYDYVEQYLIPAVSDLLDLNSSELTDQFTPSEQLVNQFLSKVVVRGKRVETYNKKLKKMGVEEELYPPQIAEESSNSVAEIRLFQLVSQSLVNFKNRQNEVLRFVVEKGSSLGDGVWITTFEDIFTALNIPRETARDSIIFGVGLMYREEYNNAVKNLRNRTRQISNQGYLDF